MRAATQLMWRYHCRAKDIIVLTQYRAQRAEIERQLAEKVGKDIAVSTVVASQGERPVTHWLTRSNFHGNHVQSVSYSLHSCQPVKPSLALWFNFHPFYNFHLCRK